MPPKTLGAAEKAFVSRPPAVPTRPLAAAEKAFVGTETQQNNKKLQTPLLQRAANNKKLVGAKTQLLGFLFGERVYLYNIIM